MAALRGRSSRMDKIRMAAPEICRFSPVKAFSNS